MTEQIIGRLHDRATIAGLVDAGRAPDWVAAHWRTFRDGLLGERNGSPFPCFFGPESVRDGEPLYTAVPSTTDPDALLGRGCVLLEYLVTFQPRALFESLDATADTEFGRQARGIIPDRLVDYDGVCPHADLGDWGVEGDREWRQYMLSEDDVRALDERPITVTREHPKSDVLADGRGLDRPLEGQL